LRQFFEGLSGTGEDVKAATDDVYLDVFPQTTRELDQWEEQFGLTQVPLTEQERRDRLDAAWKQQGGQSPRYIQDTLQANGFNVFIHQWWVPGTEMPVNTPGCVTPRVPSETIGFFGAQCGEPSAQCGEPSAQCGNSLLARYFNECGEQTAQCGEEGAQCGAFAARVGYMLVNKSPNFNPSFAPPTEVDKQAYILYIGGINYTDVAEIPATRKDEFETLCLKICPTQQWLGIIVRYT
jgi:hypothetical protein